MGAGLVAGWALVLFALSTCGLTAQCSHPDTVIRTLSNKQTFQGAAVGSGKAYGGVGIELLRGGKLQPVILLSVFPALSEV